ncbi:hypothetical protein A6A04_19075 [Paramagnetospirillum marisnigri]|uniref:Uncharacterized protein n=1 Tax=Paramagnetospirillum marisnigri TaxID=1285242 RepID=A0A178MNF7_9PROT|nr:hypothetical protein A6A04_19075 [Paramagnetospirillum marisnigri]
MSLHQQGGAHRHRKSSGGGGHKVAALIALALVLAAFGLGAFLLRPNTNTPASISPEAFVDQMEKASQGVVFERNLYGGPIRVQSKGGQVTVTADNIPPSICVSVGWKLVRKGLLSINGVTPLRVSAAKLSELCNQDDTYASLAWTPKSGD